MRIRRAIFGAESGATASRVIAYATSYGSSIVEVGVMRDDALIYSTSDAAKRDTHI